MKSHLHEDVCYAGHSFFVQYVLIEKPPTKCSEYPYDGAASSASRKQCSLLGHAHICIQNTSCGTRLPSLKSLIESGRNLYGIFIGNILRIKSDRITIFVDIDRRAHNDLGKCTTILFVNHCITRIFQPTLY